MNCKYIANPKAGAGVGGKRRYKGGFSLIEMLAVVAIMVILLAMVGRSFTTVGTRAVSGAERLSSSIGLAGSYATARNRLVWVKIEPKADGSGNTEVKFYQSNDGTNAAASVVEFRRSVVLEMVQVRDDLGAFSDRPVVPSADRMKPGSVLIIKPSGEIYLVNDVSGTLPLPDGVPLRMITEIGLQGVHGRSGKPVEADLSAVHVRGISGNPITYIP